MKMILHCLQLGKNIDFSADMKHQFTYCVYKGSFENKLEHICLEKAAPSVCYFLTPMTVVTHAGG
jgi:hypothetical protein